VAEEIELDPQRAVAIGLMINELATNAIKHAFPHGEGRLVLGARRLGGQLEFIVSDNGVGMVKEASATNREVHGSDYVAIFVRQLGGQFAVSMREGGGTLVTVSAPLLLSTGG
jgi:two-component sensor histidine kinase